MEDDDAAGAGGVTRKKNLAHACADSLARFIRSIFSASPSICTSSSSSHHRLPTSIACEATTGTTGLSRATTVRAEFAAKNDFRLVCFTGGATGMDAPVRMEREPLESMGETRPLGPAAACKIKAKCTIDKRRL